MVQIKIKKIKRKQTRRTYPSLLECSERDGGVLYKKDTYVRVASVDEAAHGRLDVESSGSSDTLKRSSQRYTIVIHSNRGDGKCGC